MTNPEWLETHLAEAEDALAGATPIGAYAVGMLTAVGLRVGVQPPFALLLGVRQAKDLDEAMGLIEQIEDFCGLMRADKGSPGRQ